MTVNIFHTIIFSLPFLYWRQLESVCVSRIIMFLEAVMYPLYKKTISYSKRKGSTIPNRIIEPFLLIYILFKFSCNNTTGKFHHEQNVYRKTEPFSRTAEACIHHAQR